MRSFLLKLFIFLFLICGLYAGLLHKLSQGPVDEYYNKFTQNAEGLILGLSRADQGIVPSILSDSLSQGQGPIKMVNFAMNQSFYGQAYLNAIQEKLIGNRQDGIFLLSVNPGCFTAPNGFGKEEIVRMDSKTILGKLHHFATSPNYDYLSCCYGSSLYNVFYNTSTWEHFVFHDDGWNEVVLETPRKSISEADMRHWTELNLRFYRLKLKTEEFKPYRKDYFIQTIAFLKERGDVFLVRMPAAPEIIALENEQWPEFDSLMDNISTGQGIPYLNFSKEGKAYKTYDGSHLYSESAKAFTRDLVFRIKNLYSE